MQSPSSGTDAAAKEARGGDSATYHGLRVMPLGLATLAVAYIPDFPFADVQFWFSPSREAPAAAHHELLGRSDDKWETYYNKKGWRFVRWHAPAEREAEGPFRAKPGELRLRILEPGRFFAPRPTLSLAGGPEIPILGLEKRRPLNPWKPTYIKALNFIKKYEWPRQVPKPAEAAIWEIEECGEVPGSTSWQNAELLLEDNVCPELLEVLADLFEKRPEEFPLGSQVYLRRLGHAGAEGFRRLADLHRLPAVRKRKHVAEALGTFKNAEAIDTLLALLDDEDPEVRSAALRSLGRIGVPADDSRAEPLRKALEAEDVGARVWAAQALLKGGDDEQRKFLITLLKEQEARPLHDMGEMGEVLADLRLTEAVPFLIHRLKSEKSELQADAGEVLRALTGLPLEFAPGDEEGRRDAIKASQRWWEELKKERRKSAAG